MKVERKTKVRSEEKIPKSTKKVRTRDKFKGIELAADDVVILTYFSVLLGTKKKISGGCNSYRNKLANPMPWMSLDSPQHLKLACNVSPL